jgi:hypothetical protein
VPCNLLQTRRRHDARLPVSGASWIHRAPLVITGLAHSELEDVTRAPPIAIKGGGVSTSVAAVRSYGTTTVRWVHEAGDNEHCGVRGHGGSCDEQIRRVYSQHMLDRCSVTLRDE